MARSRIRKVSGSPVALGMASKKIRWRFCCLWAALSSILMRWYWSSKVPRWLYHHLDGSHVGGTISCSYGRTYDVVVFGAAGVIYTVVNGLLALMMRLI